MDAKGMVKRLAAQTWGCGEERVLTDDYSNFYPWLRQHRVHLAVGPSGRSAFFALDPQGATIAFFHDPDYLAANVQALNRLLKTEGASLPGVLAPLHLAQTLRDWLLGTQGFVGSADLWEEQALATASWVRTLSVEQTTALFKKYCQDPVLTFQPEGWTLTFFFFNRVGAVEQWTISGTPQQLRNAAFQLAEPVRTFRFPYR
jgi:hypothetical protein